MVGDGAEVFDSSGKVCGVAGVVCDGARVVKVLVVVNYAVLCIADGAVVSDVTKVGEGAGVSDKAGVVYGTGCGKVGDDAVVDDGTAEVVCDGAGVFDGAGVGDVTKCGDVGNGAGVVDYAKVDDGAVVVDYGAQVYDSAMVKEST